MAFRMRTVFAAVKMGLKRRLLYYDIIPAESLTEFGKGTVGDIKRFRYIIFVSPNCRGIPREARHTMPAIAQFDAQIRTSVSRGTDHQDI